MIEQRKEGKVLMIKRIGITGPMWSGKTHELIAVAEAGKTAIGGSVLGIEPYWNRRRTGRDLTEIAYFSIMVLGGGQPFTEQAHGEVVIRDSSTFEWRLSKADVYALDEVHMYEVYGQLEPFIQLVLLLPGIVILSGLWSDCYHGYDTFRVWRELVPHLNELRVLQSRIPCAQCGDPEAQYSQSTGGPKVGDSYVNVCRLCRG